MDIRFWDVFDRNIVVCKCVMYVIIKMLAIFLCLRLIIWSEQQLNFGNVSKYALSMIFQIVCANIYTASSLLCMECAKCEYFYKINSLVVNDNATLYYNRF